MNIDFLEGVKTIAVVGLSDKPERPSYQVAQFLQQQGYIIIPVNPLVSTVLGEKSYATLSSIPKETHIDLVDIFRRSEEVFAIVKEAIALNIQHVWMQEGITNAEAMKYAEDHGATVAADVCLMKTIQKSTISSSL